MMNGVRFFRFQKCLYRHTDVFLFAMFILGGMGFYAMVRGVLVSPYLPVHVGTKHLFAEWLPASVLGSAPSLFYAATLVCIASMLRMNRGQAMTSGVLGNTIWEILQTTFHGIGTADFYDIYAGVMGGVLAYALLVTLNANRDEPSTTHRTRHRPRFAANMTLVLVGAFAGFACGEKPFSPGAKISDECRKYYYKKRAQNIRRILTNERLHQFIPTNPIVKGTTNYIVTLHPNSALHVVDRRLVDRPGFKWSISAQDVFDFVIDGDVVYMKRFEGVSKVSLQPSGTTTIQTLKYQEIANPDSPSDEPLGPWPPNCSPKDFPLISTPKPSPPSEIQPQTQLRPQP